MAAPARVVLKRGRARPLWFGHPWVYANAVERLEGSADPGDVVALVDSDQRFIGQGLWNGRSQIACRLLTRTDEAIDGAFFRRRLESARALRARLGLPSAETNAYRLVNSEGDGLPGLVIDLYGDAAVLQITTLGLWRRRDEILDAVSAVVAPATIFEVAATGFSDVEGFQPVTRVARGVSRPRVPCREEGIALEVEPTGGQKTGLFLDQRETRRRVGAMARDARVLDLYAYVGGFSLQAARGGARSVTAVDSSARAIARIEAHAAANGVADRVRAAEADAFRFLEAATPRAYDLVICDPPKFARAKKDVDAARKGYERLNALALGVCAPGAVLVTCSCSQNVDETELERIVAAAAKTAARQVRVFDRSGPGGDHPLPPAFAEGRYLKVLWIYVD